MKKITLLMFSIALFGFYGQSAYGCSCLEVKSDKKQKVDYKQWLKAFDGAVFTGQVVKIERIESTYQIEVTFKVERYWKGVHGSDLKIQTAMDGAACGVTYREGKQYFVIANRSGGKLSTDLCSWLGYSKNEKAYLEGLGEGKCPQARQASDSQTTFFEDMKKLCGQRFVGATEFPQNPDHPLVGKKLVITVDSCSDKEVRIPFQVGEDKSRTWILRLDERGLLFKHDHRHPDGTPDKVTMYGGWAAPEGTAHRQRFPADSDTKELIPEAATNVWTVEIDKEKQQLVYYLERHNEPRYRAVFKLVPIKK